MRLAPALLLLALATPALADPPDAPVWSVDVHERRGGQSVDTVMTLTRTGTGWTVEVTCQVTDVRTGRYRTVKDWGTALRLGHQVRGALTSLGRFVIEMPADPAGRRYHSNDVRCANGSYNLGTGD